METKKKLSLIDKSKYDQFIKLKHEIRQELVDKGCDYDEASDFVDDAW